MMTPKRLLTMAATIALCTAGLVAPGTAQADDTATCEVERLPVPDDVNQTMMDAGSPDGSHYVGRIRPPGDPTSEQPVMWRDREYEELDIALAQITLTAVNDSGTIIGEGDAEDGTTQSFVHEDGKTTVLDDRNGVNPTLTGINAGGDVVGLDPEAHVALRWDAESRDEAEVLPAPGPAAARDIADDGTVVGYLGVPEAKDKAYLWHPDGSHDTLSTPEGRDYAFADHIRGDQVGGGAGDELGGPSSGTHWDLSTGTVTELGGVRSVSGVNSSGELAVNTYTTADQGALVRDGEVIHLPGLTEMDVTTTFGISDAGDIVGDNFNEETYDVTPLIWSGC
ncbi:MAG: hypothetical protein ACTH2Q_16845 [Propionibacteriaceae bacterium]